MPLIVLGTLRALFFRHSQGDGTRSVPITFTWAAGSMRILAIETTDKAGSLALLEDDRLLAAAELDPQDRSARSLAPALRDLITQAGWRPADIQLVAVAAGPGSFTGLRVGITTAKTLAYVAAAEVVAVNTLEVIAWQSPSDVQELAVVMDAQRQEVFAGEFARSAAGQLNLSTDVGILPEDVWLARLKPGQHVSGPALQKLGGRLPAGVIALDSALWKPTATATGQLAYQRYLHGQRDSLWTLAPLYLRRSAAEEKLDSKAVNPA